MKKVWLVFVEEDELNSPFIFSSAYSAFCFCLKIFLNDDSLEEQEREMFIDELSESYVKDPENFNVQFVFVCFAKEVIA